MMVHRLLSLFLIVSLFSAPLSEQVITPQPPPTSGTRTVALTVDNGTPLQIALDREGRVRKSAEPSTGRVVQPVYVCDHLVIPGGTLSTCRTADTARVP